MGHLVSTTNKTDCHDITEILLKQALNTIKPTNQPITSTKSPLLFSDQIAESKILLNVPIKRGHLTYNATFSLQKGWPYKRGTTVIESRHIIGIKVNIYS